MISFILWGVETLWHMTRWSTMNDWETSSGWFCSSFDVCHEALSKDEKAAILADIEDEKQKKLQVPFWSNVSSTSTRACFCVFVSSITLRCLELQVPISWVAATLWTKPTDATLLVFWVFCAQRQALQEKQKQQQKKTCSQFLDGYFEACCSNKNLFLSDFGGTQCLLPAYCGICRWTVATTKPWGKSSKNRRSRMHKGAEGHPSPLCFDICEGLVTLVLAVCPCQVPDWAGRGSWRGTTKAEGPRVHHFYVMNCQVTTDAGDALCWCQIWSQIRLTGSRAEEMAEAVLLLDFFVVAGVWCAHLVWRVRKGIVDGSSTVDAERCPEVVGTHVPTIHINSQHINTEPCNFLWFWLDGLPLFPTSQMIQMYSSQEGRARPCQEGRGTRDDVSSFSSSMCHTEKRNRAQERDAVLLQELQEKELLDVMNLAVDEAALPCPLSGYVEPSFYGPFVLEEMSRVVSTLKFGANTLSDINSLGFHRSHDFLAAGDWKERATESARTVKARSNVGS